MLTVILNSNHRIDKENTNSNNCEYNFDWGILPEGRYRLKYSIVKTLNQSVPFIFKVKSSSGIVPTVVDGLTLINTNNVTMINDASRGFVFTFNGTNSLRLNVATPVTSTKTFWLSAVNPANDFNNIYSTVTRPIYFARTSFLKAFVNFSTNTKVESNLAQTVEWKFYAITVSGTESKMYVNGELIQTQLATSNGENNPISFGCYENGAFYTGLIDDMRMYSSILSPAYIKRMYLENI